MQTLTLLVYSIIAVLCVAAPFAGSSPRLAMALLPYAGWPFALASFALAASAWSRRGLAALELSIAGLWGVGAVGLCANVASPPLEFKTVLVGMRVQGVLAGLAVAGVILAACVAWRSLARPVTKIPQSLALLVLAVFLGRRGLMGIGALPGTGGLEAISRELWLTQVVVGGCALVLVGSVALRVGLDRQMANGPA